MHAGQVLSEVAKRKIAERERQRQAADAKGADLSGAQIADLKRQIAALLQPKESLSRGFKRLRPAKPAKGALCPSCGVCEHGRIALCSLGKPADADAAALA